MIPLPNRTPELVAALRRDCPDDPDRSRQLETLLRRHPPEAGKPAIPGEWGGVCFTDDGAIFINPDLRPVHIFSTYLHEVAHALTPWHGHDHIFQAEAEKLYAFFSMPDWSIDRRYDCHTAAPLAQRPEAIRHRAATGAWHAERAREAGALDLDAIQAGVRRHDVDRAEAEFLAELAGPLAGVVVGSLALAFLYFRDRLTPIDWQAVGTVGAIVFLVAAVAWAILPGRR